MADMGQWCLAMGGGVEQGRQCGIFGVFGLNTNNALSRQPESVEKSHIGFYDPHHLILCKSLVQDLVQDIAATIDWRGQACHTKNGSVMAPTTEPIK